jgi:two-component system chemotaxis response regulator CheB/chemosensory pili system protein ChpB (putative protein-glutamate methylesterase)
VRNTQSNVAVALLYQTQELGRHMRDALSSLGTPIVYEAATDHLDSTALQESGARVVVVNLDPALEVHLDEVYGLLEDDRYSVVFNDAQVSSGLSGWDQARWVRHLAAKILGDVDIDPPRPEGAATIPTARPVAAAAVEAEHEDVADDVPSVEAMMESASRYAFDNSAAVEKDHDYAAVDTVAKASDPRDVLESRFDELNQPAASTLPSPRPPPDEGFDFSTLEAVTADAPTPRAEDHSQMFAAEFADDPQSVAAENSGEPSESQLKADVEIFDLAALDALFGDGPSVQTISDDKSSAIDVGDLGDFGTIEKETPAGAANDVETEEASAPSFTLMDEADFESVSAAPIEKAAAPESSPKLAAAADWSLEDMLEGDVAPPPPPAPVAASEFGIEKLSAAEYLAHDTEGTAPPAPVPVEDFEFELMPMEDAVAPQPVQRADHEAWLDPDKISVPLVAKIRRVWVLGASIGGPEAVREFLAELPRDYPALFLLAQHMGAEFVDLMAQQLAKATALTVRTPTHGERVGHGEVVIVPTTHRLQVDPEGIVVLERSSSDAAYAPSIDRAMQDAADRYGAHAGAIIFSGMTTDAVEGSKYIAGKGGTVYAQHPDTCVVSSMVDGAIEAGIVKVLGTPRELAELLLADSSKK